MPVDEAGNRADIVMDANSVVSRMNPGKLYEHYINACARDTTVKIRRDLGITSKDKSGIAKLNDMFDNDKHKFTIVYDYLMGFYSIISPRMFKCFSELSDEGKLNHLIEVVKKAIYTYMPTDNDVELVTMVNQLEKHYKPVYGPVTYIGNSGELVKTKSNVRISSVYIMLLEKLGDDWSSVSSGKLQHFGILSQLTKNDKTSQPTRNQAVKAIGETEGRILASYCGQTAVAEAMDRNNNPTTHKEVVFGILNANNPSNIDNLVDRNKFPYGGAKPLQLINHIAQCSGWEYVYTSKKIKYDFNPSRL